MKQQSVKHTKQEGASAKHRKKRVSGTPRNRVGAIPAREVDWEAIECDYREAKFSLRELTAIHGPSPATIMRRANSEGWERDLSLQIQRATKRAVTQAVVAEAVARLPPSTDIPPHAPQAMRDLVIAANVHSSHKEGNLTISEAVRIEAAAQLGKHVILQHRQDVAQTRQLVMHMIEELALGTMGREIVLKLAQQIAEMSDGDDGFLMTLRERVLTFLDLGERSKTAQRLVASLAKLQEHERRAYELDVPEKDKERGDAAYRKLSDIERANRISDIFDRARNRRTEWALGIGDASVGGAERAAGGSEGLPG